MMDDRSISGKRALFPVSEVRVRFGLLTGGLAAGMILLSPGLAAAACATQDAMATGVRFVDVEGTVTEARPLDQDRVEIRIDYGDGTGVIEQRLFGLYPLVQDEVLNGEVLPSTRITFAYDGGETVLPPPHEIEGFSIASVMSFDGGSSDWVVTFDAARATGQTELSGCSYATREIRVESQGPLDPVQWEVYLYFTELGVAHLSSSGVGNLVFDTEPVIVEALE